MSAGGGKKKKGLAKMAGHVGPNMTPMVDIVMCILIFFMLGSSFLAAELFLTSNMVVSDKGLADSNKKVVDIPAVQLALELQARAEGTVVYHSAHFSDRLLVGRPDDPKLDTRDGDSQSDIDRKKQEKVTQRELNKAIENRLKALKAGGFGGDALVVLKPKGNVPYEDVIKVYDACNAANFAKVAFSP